MNKKNTMTLEEFTTKHYGKKGTPKRDEYEKGYAYFKFGVLIHIARIEKGLTQKQLADKCKINKANISKAENNILDLSISTLRKIVEVGLGGQLQLSIRV